MKGGGGGGGGGGVALVIKSYWGDHFSEVTFKGGGGSAKFHLA